MKEKRFEIKFNNDHKELYKRVEVYLDGEKLGLSQFMISYQTSNDTWLGAQNIMVKGISKEKNEVYKIYYDAILDELIVKLIEKL